MTEHTEGPWTYEYDNDGNGHFREWYSVGPKDHWIAMIRIGRVKSNEEANAQLIAAAPATVKQRDQLLEALQDILKLRNTIEVLGVWVALDTNPRLRETERAKVDKAIEAGRAAILAVEAQPTEAA